MSELGGFVDSWEYGPLEGNLVNYASMGGI